jgi:hypothetical protein
MTFKEILNRKIKYYGKTEAAYEFAAEEYSNILFKEAQAKQLNLSDVVVPKGTLCDKGNLGKIKKIYTMVSGEWVELKT